MKIFFIKHFVNAPLLSLYVVVTLFILSCNSNEAPKAERVEDKAAKSSLQGTWVNEFEGNTVFTVKGDTIYYNDTLSTPAAFFVADDTLFIENHTMVKYPIRKLNSASFVFVNVDGDEVSLTKSESGALAAGEYRGTVSLNQGKKIKKDTVIVFGEKRYHAYTQVNPTTYKVFRQTTNNEGLRVESVYYDNIVYIALYEGQTKIFGQNVTKSDFSKLVPDSYLSQAVLSDIKMTGATAEGVCFEAILSIPDSYTNYRVKIMVSPDGKKTMSL